MDQMQDRKERSALADMYLLLTRCKGGRVLVQGYCCPWCGSVDPGEECGKPREDEKNKESVKL